MASGTRSPTGKTGAPASATPAAPQPGKTGEPTGPAARAPLDDPFAAPPPAPAAFIVQPPVAFPVEPPADAPLLDPLRPPPPAPFGTPATRPRGDRPASAQFLAPTPPPPAAHPEWFDSVEDDAHLARESLVQAPRPRLAARARAPAAATPAAPQPRPRATGLLVGGALAAALGAGGAVWVLRSPPAPALTEGTAAPAVQMSRGRIRISTIPPDADVWLDGVQLGERSPTEVTDLELGRQFVINARKGNLVGRAVVTVTRSAPVAGITLSLEPLPAAPRR